MAHGLVEPGVKNIDGREHPHITTLAFQTNYIKLIRLLTACHELISVERHSHIDLSNSRIGHGNDRRCKQ